MSTDSALRQSHIAIDDDILVVGYIKRMEKVCGVSIPGDIVKLCHSYWGLFICDLFDKEWVFKDAFSTDEYQSCVTALTKSHNSIYGEKIVSSGVFTWKLKMKRKGASGHENHPFIGVIKNDPAWMRKYLKGCMWHYGDRGYFVCGKSGKIAPPAQGKRYCDGRFMNDGDTLALTLDLDKQIICYSMKNRNIG